MAESSTSGWRSSRTSSRTRTARTLIGEKEATGECQKEPKCIKTNTVFWTDFELVLAPFLAFILHYKSPENAPRIVAKALHHRFQRVPGSHLGTTFVQRWPQDIISDDFGSILAGFGVPNGGQDGPQIGKLGSDSNLFFRLFFRFSPPYIHPFFISCAGIRVGPGWWSGHTCGFIF